MNTVDWKRYPDELPPKDSTHFLSDEFGGYCSIEVLIYDSIRKRVWIGTLQNMDIDDSDYEYRWISGCSEGWELKNITHWAYQVEPPK